MTTLVDHGYIAGQFGSIHPMDKTPVGKRLHLAAMAHVYNKPGLIATGPLAKEAGLLPSGIVVWFEPATVSQEGLALRLNNRTARQECAVGQTQITGKPTAPVP